MQSYIHIRGARLHNLKNINLDIPKNQFVVLTGLSGSGKSTLGYDILYKEGVRQYVESLGMVSMLAKPPVDSISGLSPSISVDQYLTNQSPRSTVGTSSEVYTYLRVLYGRIGHRPCPACGQDIAPDFDMLDLKWQGENDDESVMIDAIFPCPHCGSAISKIGMANFSFNKPAGACPTCTGLGMIHQVNLKKLVNEELSISEGAVYGWDVNYTRHYSNILKLAAAHYGFTYNLATPVKNFSAPQRDLLFYGVESPRFQAHFPDIRPPATVSQGRFEGVAPILLRRHAEHILDPDYREKIGRYLITQACPDCQGTRLRPESRMVTIDGQRIEAISRMALSELSAWIHYLPNRLCADELHVAAPILNELNDRLARLLEVGIDYLSLERPSPSLSAGEAQRLRLAALLGSSLTGVLYVLDEPTIGLHQRDTQRLIEFLRRLRDRENTVLVIEHDLELIRAADYVVDIGPGAGKAGGWVVATGSPSEVAHIQGSATGAFLDGRAKVGIPAQRRKPGKAVLSIRGACQNNLKGISVSIPLGMLVAVTGVSGSGKSSLVFDIINRAARQRFYGANEAPGMHECIDGWEHLNKVIAIDQENLRRIPRSNVATYSDTFTPIREVFAKSPRAKYQSLTARSFSFNLPGGRCERCEGTGMLFIKMHFLPDVEVRCPACGGQRYKPEILSVDYRGLNISQVLDLTAEEALVEFKDVPLVASRLQVMVDVGLGYLQLGQPSTTLSAGEAQRVKLAKELGRKAKGRTLYLLDEPTIGLHLADIDRLLSVLHGLVDNGNTILVIEHNLEVIRAADWVIDLGPEGGSAGGRLLAEGTPEQVAQVEASYTGRFLRTMLG